MPKYSAKMREEARLHYNMGAGYSKIAQILRKRHGIKLSRDTVVAWEKRCRWVARKEAEEGTEAESLRDFQLRNLERAEELAEDEFAKEDVSPETTNFRNKAKAVEVIDRALNTALPKQQPPPPVQVMFAQIAMTPKEIEAEVAKGATIVSMQSLCDGVKEKSSDK